MTKILLHFSKYLGESYIRVSSTGGIPIVFSAADGDKLVIGIDADVLLTNTTYTESQVQELLGTTCIFSTPAEYMLIDTNIYARHTITDSDNKLNIFVSWENVVNRVNIHEPQ